MDRTKLGACLIAAVITLAGASYLAQPAQAAEAHGPCSATQEAYARGYADGSCGSGGGTVTSCEDTGSGGFSFSWMCNPI